MARRQTTPRKHVPQRTCIACREQAGKRGLVRIVKTQEGIQVDPSGKLAGRGAYLHPVPHCWEIALQGNRLAQALRRPINPLEREHLEAYMHTLAQDLE